jgi:hypothetical protein
MVAEKKTVSFTDDVIQGTIGPLRDFFKDSVRLVNRCEKPNAKGYSSNSLPI